MHTSLMSRKSLLLLFLSLTPVSAISQEFDLPIPYKVEDACPFAGCSFGDWTVLRATKVREQPRLLAPEIARLEPGKVRVNTGVIFVEPGMGRISAKLPKSAEKLDGNKPVWVLDYEGEGVSRIYQDGEFIHARVARRNGDCPDGNRDPDCWLLLESEPVEQWWVQVNLPNDQPFDQSPAKRQGWVLMDGALKALDDFACIE